MGVLAAGDQKSIDNFSENLGFLAVMGTPGSDFWAWIFR